MSAFAGTAHVKIEPDLSGFKEELKAKLGPTVGSAKVPVNLNLDRASAARVDAEVKAQTRPITRKVKLEHDHNSFQATEKAFGGVERRVSGLGGVLKGMYGEAAKITAVGLGSQAVSALGAAAVTTTAALAPLGGLLAAYPAVASAGGQALGVWKLAFSGVSAAVGGLNNEINKNSQAWKSLTPEGKRFAEQLQAMKAPLRELSAESQKGLMPGLQTGMKSAMANFPILRKQVGETAKVMGGLATEAGKLIGSKGFGRDLDTQMGRNQVTIRRLGEAGLYLGDGMRHIVLAAGPLVDWLTKTALAGAKNVDQWAAAGRKSGEFAKFFVETKHVMTDVGHIAGDLGVGLFNIFKLAYPEGKSFLDVQVKLADKFKDWTKSAAGQNRIKQFFHDARPAMDEAEKLIGALLGDFGKLGQGTQVAPLLRMLRVDLLPRLYDMVDATTKSFGPPFINAVSQFVGLWTEFGGTSGPLVSSVKLFGEMAQGVTWLLHNVPGLKPIIYAIAIAGGINKALGISSAISGLLRMQRELKIIAALSAISGGAGIPGIVPVGGGKGMLGKLGGLLGRGAATEGVVAAEGAAAAGGVAAAAGGAEAAAGGLALLGGPAGIAAVAGLLAAPVIISAAAPFVGKLLGGGPSHADRVASRSAGGFGTGFAQSQPGVDYTKQIAQLQRQGEEFQARQQLPFGAAAPDAAKWGAKAAAAFKRQGSLIAKQLEVGWNQYKFQDAPTMLKQLQNQLRGLKPAAQAAAVQSAVAFAQGLERNKRLPAGSAQAMLEVVEREFPKLTRYLGKSAQDASKAFNNGLSFNQTYKTVHTTLGHIEDDFGGMREFIKTNMKHTGNDILDQSNAAAGYLTNITKYGTGPMKRQAAADLKQLQADTAKYLGQTATVVNQNMVTIQGAIRSGSASAARDAAASFGSFAASTQAALKSGALNAGQAAKLIGDSLNAMLTVFGSPTIPLAGLSAASIVKWENWWQTGNSGGGPDPQRGKIGHRATGGLLEIGRRGFPGHDTIPMNVGGTDIVVGEGETAAILTRHQRAELDMRLAREGGLGGWFSRRRKPNYMSQGGLVERYSVGGKVAGLHPDFMSELNALSRGTGVNITVNSGYRSDAQQAALFAAHPDPKWVARPGTSMHRTGEAADIAPGISAYGGKEGQYGLYFPMSWEPWHIQNVSLRGGAVPSGLGGGAMPHMPHVNIGGRGTMSRIVQALADKGVDAANKYIDAHQPAPTSAGEFGVAGAGSPAQARAWTTEAMKLAGVSGSGWLNMLLRQESRESGYDPNSVNTTDINAQRGDPSKGILQTTGSTFRQYMAAGHTNILNPVDNIIAAINYMIARYGHGDKAAALQTMIARGGGAYSRGGLIRAATGHLSTGGAGLAPRGALTGAGAALTGAGATALKRAKWWQNLAPILREIKSKSKHGQPDLTRFLNRIKGLGLGGPQDAITQNVNVVTKDAAYAETAGGLIDTEALGRALVNDPSWQKPELYPANWDSAKDALPQGVENIQKGVIDNFLQQYKVLGKTQLGWLTQELADQATLRGNLISLAKKIREDWTQRTRVLDAARKKAQRLRDHIKHLTSQINAKLKQLHPPKGHKPPSKAQATQLNKDIKRLRGDLAGDQRELDALVHPDTGVIPVTEAQLQTLTDALGTGGMHGGQDLPKLYQSYGPSSDGVMGQLYALEGPVTSPFRRLGAHGAATLMAEGPRVWFGDIGNVLTQIAGYDKQWFQQPSLPSSSDAAAIPEDLFAKQLQQWAGERSGLSALEGMTLSRYGGSFDKGGTVPGPVGAPILITAHGGEEVLSLEDRAQGSHTFEIHGDPRTVAMLEQMIEKVNVKSNRGQARSADRRMRLPGNAVR